MTWEYIFMGIGMKTGTGMGTGTYSLLMPSSTSEETNIAYQEKLDKRGCVCVVSTQLFNVKTL